MQSLEVLTWNARVYNKMKLPHGFTPHEIKKWKKSHRHRFLKMSLAIRNRCPKLQEIIWILALNRERQACTWIARTTAQRVPGRGRNRGPMVMDEGSFGDHRFFWDDPPSPLAPQGH